MHVCVFMYTWSENNLVENIFIFLPGNQNLKMFQLRNMKYISYKQELVSTKKCMYTYSSWLFHIT